MSEVWQLQPGGMGGRSFNLSQPGVGSFYVQAVTVSIIISVIGGHFIAIYGLVYLVCANCI